MTSANYRRLAREYEDMTAMRDIRGLAGLAVVGAAGGVVAAEVSSRAMDILFDGGAPSGMWGKGATFSAKLATALALGMLALRLDGMVGNAFAIAGAGAAVVAGADGWRALMDLNLLEGSTGSAPSRSGSNSPSSNRNRGGSVGSAGSPSRMSGASGTGTSTRTAATSHV